MSGGVAAALDEAMKAQPDPDEVLQGTLFEGAGVLDAPSPLSAALVPKGRGRPPGSRNRRTKATADWLLSLYRSPLAVMAEGYSMSPADFLRSAGLRPDEKTEAGEACFSNDLLLEAVKLQMRFAEAVAPYVHQRLPLAVQVDAKASVQLSVEGVSVPARGLVAGDREAEDVVDGEVLGVRLALKSDD